MFNPRMMIFALACSLSLTGSPGRALAQVYNVDAMVGQVNGQALFTHDILDEQLCETLADWGRELPLPEFRQRATERIVVRLNALVTDALIYGEAQRDLSDRERQGLTMAVARQREQLLREYGQGSPALAEARLIEETGIGMDQTLEESRQALVVQRYMRQKLRPKVNVTRKDIKRYYEEHRERYNPPASRTVYVIQADQGEDADALQAMLDADTPFMDAADDPRNRFRPDSAGAMGDMAGQQLFAYPEVNQATLALEPGQHAGPFTVGERVWFVYVDKVNQADPRPLMEVQTEIQAILFEQQYRIHTERFREQLFKRGSYNPIQEMAMTLVQIAEDRYARKPS